MGTQLSPSAWDDEIDLREYVAVLLRRRWTLAVVVAAAVAVAAVFSYAVIEPTYESSGSYVLPVAGGQGGVGMSPDLYRAFAESDRVLQRVVDETDLGLSLQQLRNDVLDVGLQQATGTLSVTAAAPTAGGAYRIVDAWQAAFDDEVRSYVGEQLSRRLSLAEATVEGVDAAPNGPVTPRLLEAQMERDRLVGMQAQLAELTRTRALIAPTPASAPAAPNGPLNMAIAGVLALFAGVFFVFVREWWVGTDAASERTATTATTAAARPREQVTGGDERPERPVEASAGKGAPGAESEAKWDANRLPNHVSRSPEFEAAGK